jgi:hypothetical protein
VNGDARQYGCAGADPDSVVDENWLRHVGTAPLLGRTDLVVDRQERDVVSDVHAVADPHLGSEIDVERTGDERLHSDAEELPGRTGAGYPQGAHDARAFSDAQTEQPERDGSRVAERELRKRLRRQLCQGLAHVEIVELFVQQALDPREEGRAIFRRAHVRRRLRTSPEPPRREWTLRGRDGRMRIR